MSISIPSPSDIAGPDAAGATAKAFFMVDPAYLGLFSMGRPPRPTLVCRLNPKDLKITGGTRWKRAEGGQEEDQAPAQFQETTPRTMTVQLFFDQFELPSGDVAVEVETLFDWTRPRTAPTNHKSAPWLRFQWGAKRYFKCYIKSLNVTYTLFSRSGAPLRATASLTLEETRDLLPGQNPTSGGRGGERRRRIAAGDTLHSLAQDHYGVPALWRGIAAFNGIEDPLRLATGDELEIPDKSVAEELS